jgi:hypothetical protein
MERHEIKWSGLSRQKMSLFKVDLPPTFFCTLAPSSHRNRVYGKTPEKWLTRLFYKQRSQSRMIQSMGYNWPLHASCI